MDALKYIELDQFMEIVRYSQQTGMTYEEAEKEMQRQKAAFEELGKSAAEE